MEETFLRHIRAFAQTFRLAWQDLKAPMHPPLTTSAPTSLAGPGCGLTTQTAKEERSRCLLNDGRRYL